MDSTLWPSTLPELFRHAAGRLLSEQEPETIVEHLRTGLGVDQHLRLDGEELSCARDAANRDPGEFERLALTVAMVTGRQLFHEYPSSSIVWDAVYDEMHDVFGTFGFTQPTTGVWNREADRGRVIVIELRETITQPADERRFTLRWGVVLPGVPFCRHVGAHQMSCCAIAGGMGSVREPHGEHQFILSLGIVMEQLAEGPLRMVGREGFRARLHRLASFCERVVDRDRLVELVSGQPWRSGIGIAEKLRNADPGELGDLLT